MMRKLIVLFLSLGLALSSTSNAAVRRVCIVAYETRSGYSAGYMMEATFLTGRELNKATKSFNYNPFDNYALLWFDQGEVAILEIDSVVFGVGQEFNNNDFKRLFQFLGETSATQVNSEYSRKWLIKGKDFLRWIDPRAE